MIDTSVLITVVAIALISITLAAAALYIAHRLVRRAIKFIEADEVEPSYHAEG